MILRVRRSSVLVRFYLENDINHQVLRLVDPLKLFCQIVSVDRIIIWIVKFLNKSPVGSTLLLSDFLGEFFVVEGAPLVGA